MEICVKRNGKIIKIEPDEIENGDIFTVGGKEFVSDGNYYDDEDEGLLISSGHNLFSVFLVD